MRVPWPCIALNTTEQIPRPSRVTLPGHAGGPESSTTFYRAVRDSVKTYDEELFVASSPNIYPWGYNEYLQDPVTWASEGIVDHLIPQLYRYNIDDYNFELNKNPHRPARRGTFHILCRDSDECG